MHRKFSLYAVSMALFLVLPQLSYAQARASDSDRDGLSDRTETELLEKFAPTFMISREDCSVRPAQFIASAKSPTVLDDDGTIYGQATPRKGKPGEVELRYYHLWRKDCGQAARHPDMGHVSVLVKTGATAKEARALYWYAAAHEDTACDASHITRAETIHAEDHGATVWISDGKHASFLSEELCKHGCGADRCDDMTRLKSSEIVNLGELNAPMNGIAWLRSSKWPLSAKMGQSNFPAERATRVERLPDTDIVWTNPSKRPPQAAALVANDGLTGIRATDTAMVVSSGGVSSTLGSVKDKTGSAVKSTTGSVKNTLKKGVDKTGKLFHRNKK
ncbi:MAG: hypothetical protein FWD64_07150 [Acidobacteriaceae bacterium]|nr:hypothetical protein [Acidobacteriaceae bacterium]